MSARVINAAPAEVTEVVDGDRTARFEETALTLPDAGSLGLVRKRLARPTGAPRTPLLLVHGFGQNLHAWHLSRRSLVNHLAADGHDVFALDLRGHGRSRRHGVAPPASFAPYLDEDLPAAMDAVAALTGLPRVALVGHSLGGVLAYAATARHPDRVQALVTLAAPYLWGRDARFVSALSRAAGLVGHGDAEFPMMAVRGMLRATQPLWDNRWLPLPVRAWHPGSFEPAVLAEYLARSFDRASFGELAQLTASRRDGDAHPGRAFEACDVPLLVVAGARDHLARPAAVRPAFERSRARDRTFVTFPNGHGDLLLGREAPQLLWPTLTRWLSPRIALSLALALSTAHAAHADPLGEALAAHCRPDGRLLPAARAALDPATDDADAQRARTEAAGMFAPAVFTTVLPTSDPVALGLTVDHARHPTLLPRCAIATDGTRVGLALAPRLVEVVSNYAHGALTIIAGLPQFVTAPQLAVTGTDGAVTVLDFDPDGSVTLPSRLTPGTLQVIATLPDGPIPLATWHPAPIERARVDTLTDARDLLGAVNRERARAGAAPLRRDPMLDAVAAGHARNLAALGVVSHRPTPDDGPIERLTRAQVSCERVAENVARAETLTDAHARWMGSPSHRANVLDPALDTLGLGVARRGSELYVVELFATHPTLTAGR